MLCWSLPDIFSCTLFTPAQHSDIKHKLFELPLLEKYVYILEGYIIFIHRDTMSAVISELKQKEIFSCTRDKCIKIKRLTYIYSEQTLCQYSVQTCKKTICFSCSRDMCINGKAKLYLYRADTLPAYSSYRKQKQFF
jgi:hypothetical protein